MILKNYTGSVDFAVKTAFVLAVFNQLHKHHGRLMKFGMLRFFVNLEKRPSAFRDAYLPTQPCTRPSYRLPLDSFGLPRIWESQTTGQMLFFLVQEERKASQARPLNHLQRAARETQGTPERVMAEIQQTLMRAMVEIQ